MFLACLTNLPINELHQTGLFGRVFLVLELCQVCAHTGLDGHLSPLQGRVAVVILFVRNLPECVLIVPQHVVEQPALQLGILFVGDVGVPGSELVELVHRDHGAFGVLLQDDSVGLILCRRVLQVSSGLLLSLGLFGLGLCDESLLLCLGFGCSALGV